MEPLRRCMRLGDFSAEKSDKDFKRDTRNQIPGRVTNLLRVDLGDDGIDPAIAWLDLQNLRAVAKAPPGFGNPPRERLADLPGASCRMAPDSLEGINFFGRKCTGRRCLNRAEKASIAVGKVFGQIHAIASFGRGVESLPVPPE